MDNKLEKLPISMDVFKVELDTNPSYIESTIYNCRPKKIVILGTPYHALQEYDCEYNCPGDVIAVKEIIIELSRSSKVKVPK